MCTPFGDFEVSDANECAVPTVPETEVISEGELSSGYEQWDHVEANDTNLTIDPVDRNAGIHPDFPEEATGHLRQVMRTREGRRIIADAQNGPHPTTIAPSPSRDDHPATLTTWDAVLGEDGSPNVGASAMVLLPENLQPQAALGVDGNHFDAPPEVVVGHELEHANHDTRGENRSQVAPSERIHDNAEEEGIIRGSEAQLLHERGLPARFGHGLSCHPPSD